MRSALYTGTLRHRRFDPVRHEFTYNLFMAFLDVDRLPHLMEESPLFSYNRPNWASFDDRDHFGDSSRPLRERLFADAARNGVRLPDGPVFLLTHLRYLGYAFNPVSFFYFYSKAGSIKAILAEVTNTFGERHNYWLWEKNRRKTHEFTCAKRLHVSPFQPMELDYRFVLPAPGADLIAHLDTSLDGKTTFDATLQMRRSPWSRSSLHRSLLRFPWMTAKVIASIHWEAFKLYCKGSPFFPRPEKPA